MRHCLLAAVFVSIIMHCDTGTEFHSELLALDSEPANVLGVPGTWTGDLHSASVAYAHIVDETPPPQTRNLWHRGNNSAPDAYAHIVVETPLPQATQSLSLPAISVSSMDSQHGQHNLSTASQPEGSSQGASGRRRDNAGKKTGKCRKSCDKCFERKRTCDESNPCSRCTRASEECVRPIMDMGPVMSSAAPIPGEATESDRTFELQDLEARRSGKCCVVNTFLFQQFVSHAHQHLLILTWPNLFLIAGTQQNLIQSMVDASVSNRAQWTEIVSNTYRQDGMYGGTWTKTGKKGTSAAFVCESVIGQVYFLIYSQFVCV